MPDPNAWGLRLRELRKAAKLTQDDLGERICVSGSRISNLERGAENLTPSLVTRLAVALGVSPESLEPEIPDPSTGLTLRGRGTVVLLRDGSTPGFWLAEGGPFSPPEACAEEELGRLIRLAVGTGYQVIAPALPPVE